LIPPKKTTTNTLPSLESKPSSIPNNFRTIIPISNTERASLIINWKQTKIIDPERQYFSYDAKPLLSETIANQIASKLDFLESEKKILSHNNIIWRSADQQQILLYTPTEEAIAYQNLIPPTSSKPFVEEEVSNKALGIIKGLLPELNYSLGKITYFKDSLYSEPTTNTLGEIAQVSINQTINNFPVVPDNLSNDYTITIFLNKDLSIKTFSINNGFISAQKNIYSQIFDFEKLKTFPIDSFVSLTPLKLTKQDLLNNGSSSALTVESIEPGYIGISASLVPVYLIKGKLKVDNFPQFPDSVIYIAPMSY